MKRSRRSASLSLGILVFLIAFTVLRLGGDGRGATKAILTSTPYHEGMPTPAASVEPANTTQPLPGSVDRNTTDSMTDAGLAMIQAAQSMEAAATLMAASGDPTLVSLAGHWLQDAQALRTRGAWMIVTATSDSMVHDPDAVHELNIANLQANGVAMELEGEAMAEHGRAMIAQVEQLRANGSLPENVASDLIARGQDLITTGDQMASDGKTMQKDAERLQQSLGQ